MKRVPRIEKGTCLLFLWFEASLFTVFLNFICDFFCRFPTNYDAAVILIHFIFNFINLNNFLLSYFIEGINCFSITCLLISMIFFKVLLGCFYFMLIFLVTINVNYLHFLFDCNFATLLIVELNSQSIVLFFVVLNLSIYFFAYQQLLHPFLIHLL
jgi:hypothetical protein